MRRLRLLTLAALAGFAIGCEPSLPEGRFACTRDADCPPEQVCRANLSRCFFPDGGAADGGAADGG